jgi:ketosteroid isomerase-like protein
MHDLMKNFVDALGELHRSRDVEPLVELFSDDVVLAKAGVPHTSHGRDGARTFWTQYRDLFDDIESTFRHTVSDDGIAYLEWTSTGHLKDGSDLEYDGVSVLEGDEQAITAFRTYYDTAAFLPEGMHPAAPSR